MRKINWELLMSKLITIAGMMIIAFAIFFICLDWCSFGYFLAPSALVDNYIGQLLIGAGILIIGLHLFTSFDS